MGALVSVILQDYFDESVRGSRKGERFVFHGLDLKLLIVGGKHLFDFTILCAEL